MEKELRILHLEDVPTDAELIQRELRKAGMEFTLKRVDTKDEFIKSAEDFSPDLILSDYKLPSFDGLSALEIAKKKCPDIPFVFVTGAMGEEWAIDLMKKGATDYVLKDRLYRLAPVVQRAMKEVEELVEKKRIQEALRENEALLRTIADNAADAVICIRPGDIIYLWNRKAEEIFGYTAAEALGQKAHSLIVPEDQREFAYKGLETFYKTGKGLRIEKTAELTAIRKGNIEFPVELAVSAMRIKDEWHSTAIIRDITERKQAEETLKEQLDELIRFQKATIERELRMHEIMEENEKLKARIDELDKEVKRLRGERDGESRQQRA